jgi:hypothetical protein
MKVGRRLTLMKQSAIKHGYSNCSSVEQIYNNESSIIIPNKKGTNTLNLTLF